MKYDVVKYGVMKYDVMTYDVMKYDVMKYELMKYDVMTKHASEVPKCDHCHSEFTFKKSLARHMLLVHDERGVP